MAYALPKHKYTDLIKLKRIIDWSWLIFSGWHMEEVKSDNCLVCSKPKPNHDRINLTGF